MLLLRLATVSFSPDPGDIWVNWNYRRGDVQLATIRHWTETDSSRLLVVGAFQLAALPIKSGDGLIEVPEAPRREIERCIEDMANLVAVSAAAPRHLGTPWPPIALVPQTDADAVFLAPPAALDIHSRSLPGASVEVSPRLARTYLQDRTEGVALLAEALGSRHIGGEFQLLFKFFERAFSRPFGQLGGPLGSFLQTGEQGFQKREPTKWVGMRNPATHANRPEGGFLLEADLRPVIHRMRQAAYDVLFNKALWNTPSPARRPVYTPVAGAFGPDEDSSLTQGRDAKLTHDVVDPLDAFSYDMGVQLNVLPEGWWAQFPQSANQLGAGTTRVQRGRCVAEMNAGRRCLSLVSDVPRQLCWRHSRSLASGQSVNNWDEDRAIGHEPETT